MKQPGQIVLFHFPQTDLQPGKHRPALFSLVSLACSTTICCA
jgi:hypothetical protein